MQHLESAAIALAEPQLISTEVLIEKYAKGDESDIGQVRARVAEALARVEPAKLRKQYAQEFLWAMENGFIPAGRVNSAAGTDRSEEHTSELQSLMRISYAVFCLKKKKRQTKHRFE